MALIPQPDQRTAAWLKTLYLLAFTVYFSVLALSGHVAQILDARLAWLAYLAAGLFALLTLIAGLAALPHAPPPAFIAQLRWRVLLVLALPLAFAALLPAPEAPREDLTARSIRVDTASEGNVKPFTADPSQWDVLDWLLAFNSSEDLTRYDGQAVNVVGYAYREADFGTNEFRLAHDEQSTDVGIPVVTGERAAPDGWVHVRGVFAAQKVGGVELLVLHPTRIEPVEAPPAHTHG